jgi:transcriptional regulator with XRE-family HTH domain
MLDSSSGASTTQTFAEFICDAQTRLDLDESDVALRCKVSIQTVQRWKAGKASPHPLMAQAVRNVLS